MKETISHRTAKLGIVPKITIHRVGDLPMGRIEISAPVAYVIKSLRLELVFTMVTPEQKIRRAFPVKIENIPIGPEKFVYSMPFTSSQALYHQDGSFGETSVQWTLEAKAVVVYPTKTPNGRRDNRPQVLEGRVSLFVTQSTARPQPKLNTSGKEGSPAYILVAIFCTLVLLPFGWGVKLLAIASLIYGLFFLERLLTRKHLLRGLDVGLEVGDDGHLLFRFNSATGADDFTDGVVGVTLKERYHKLYEDADGRKKTKSVGRVLVKKFKHLKQSYRRGSEVFCSLPLNLNDYPATLDFDEYHGYKWTASYVYPRKYWMDVRTDWELQVDLVTQNQDS